MGLPDYKQRMNIHTYVGGHGQCCVLCGKTRPVHNTEQKSHQHALDWYTAQAAELKAHTEKVRS